jgi:hypothetical protein
MPVRESGSFVKSPAIFLKKMEFVNTNYRTASRCLNGCRVKRKCASLDPWEPNINFLRFSKEEQDDIAAASTDQQ